MAEICILLLALGPAAGGPAVQATDTVVQVGRGDRLVIEELDGEVAISAWDRDELEVVGDVPGDDLAVLRSGRDVRVGYPEGRRRSRPVDARIRVPVWMEIQIGSRALDLSVRGVDGPVRVGNVSGDVRVENVGGAVEVRSIRGEIIVTDARGGVRVSSQADDVTLRRVSGPVEAHSGDGDITLESISSSSVRVEAQDGDVVFTGTIEEGGSYGFFVHDGDALIGVPSSTSARVSVSTFDGEFQSDFPVRVERFTSGREFEFALGGGSASIQIEVFDGEIRLVERP